MEKFISSKTHELWANLKKSASESRNMRIRIYAEMHICIWGIDGTHFLRVDLQCSSFKALENLACHLVNPDLINFLNDSWARISHQFYWSGFKKQSPTRRSFAQSPDRHRWDPLPLVVLQCSRCGTCKQIRKSLYLNEVNIDAPLLPYQCTYIYIYKNIHTYEQKYMSVVIYCAAV